MPRFSTVALSIFGLVAQVAWAAGCDNPGMHRRSDDAPSAGGSSALPAPVPPPEPAVPPPAAPGPPSAGSGAPSAGTELLPPSPPPAGVSPNVPPTPIVPLGSGAKTEDENNSISVFRTVAPATVFVTNVRTVVDYARRSTVDVPTGTGSGFIWDTLGHVVTNHHVVQNARKFSVTLYDHRSFDAELIGIDERKDIAVLKLVGAPGDLQAIRVERGLELSVGQKTLAIGNPFGLDQTLTTGIVSAFGRSVPGAGGVTIRDMVQTDAAINPGNSGGPLLDSSGRLIGMNTMIFSQSGSSAGIGFAVPVSTIARVVPQIIKGGRPDRIGIGISIDPQQVLERQYRIRGVIVREVPPNSPAARAGLRGLVRSREGMALGDVIVGIDDEPVKNYDDLYTILDRHQPGDKVKIVVQRGGQRVELTTELLLLDD
jgi:S1-C subfamily serine protease